MLYFVRHAPTPWNEHKNANGEKDPLLQGQIDILLDEEGRNRARAMAEMIKGVEFDRVICSPLGRAKMTCYLIYNGKTPVEVNKKIEERNFGVLEGKARSKIPFKEIWNSHLKQGYKGLESIQDLEKRVFSFLDELKEWSVKNPGKNVLIVSHGGVGCIVMSYFMGRPKNGDYLSFELPHGEKPLILDFKDIVKQTDLTDNKTM